MRSCRSARAITGRAPADRTRAYFLYVVISGLVWFVLGYLMYALLYAAVGSMVFEYYTEDAPN